MQLINIAVLPCACDVTLSRHGQFIFCSCTQLCMEVIGVRTKGLDFCLAGGPLDTRYSTKF